MTTKKSQPLDSRAGNNPNSREKKSTPRFAGVGYGNKTTVSFFEEGESRVRGRGRSEPHHFLFILLLFVFFACLT